MSDEEKKPDKLFFDEKTGIVHGSECPRTKKEFGEGGDGGCALEAILKLPAPDLDSLKGREVTISIGGPAKVNSAAYREGHDRIFGTKPPVGQA
jgi:hypothetical protein